MTDGQVCGLHQPPGQARWQLVVAELPFAAKISAQIRSSGRLGVEQRRQRGPDRGMQAQEAAKARPGRAAMRARRGRLRDAGIGSSSKTAQVPANNGRIAVIIAGVRGCADPWRDGHWRTAARVHAAGGSRRLGGLPGLGSPHASYQRHLHRGLHGAHRRLARRRAYLGVKLDAPTSAIVALAALTGMALFNTLAEPPGGNRRDRLRDRRPFARHRRPRPSGGRNLPPGRRRGKPHRQHATGARRHPSDRRRDRRTGLPGAADRRCRQPCGRVAAARRFTDPRPWKHTASVVTSAMMLMAC